MKISWRIWMLIAFLILAAIIIAPSFQKGAIIKSVEKNSTAYEQGLRTGSIITAINGQAVNNFQDYSKIMTSIFPNSTTITSTNTNPVNPPNPVTPVNPVNPANPVNKTLQNNSISNNSSSNNSNINSTNNNQTLQNNTSISSNKNITKLTITTKDSEFILYDNQAPQITVSDVPTSRIKTGLDLSGGARALVKAQNKTLSANEVADLVSITSNRLNEFGIADVTVKPVTDLSGNNFMQVEVAGATPTDLNDLISQQGKFEAKVGNVTVFIGGKRDITYVARTGDQSGIYSCNAVSSGEVCNFRFAITLSPEAAQKQADTTGKLGINATNPEYLDKQLDLYLDDKLVESLFIGKDLKGSTTTQIEISGSGTGKDQQEAYNDATTNMKKLQTILITGSLPYKLEIVKIDSISPVLGKEFTLNIIYLGLIVFLGVSIVIFIRYRKIKITLGMMLTMFAEAFITLAVASLIHWNLDAPSIAGIIAGIGTGVDDQIVIIDEALSRGSDTRSLKEKIKSAFFIIFAAFFLTIAAMIPLFWAGAGMLKGFALTTIIGVSIGVLVTRPAFSDIVKLIVKE